MKRILVNRVLRLLPDKLFLSVKYWAKMHKILDLNNPQTFTEKMQWLKLYNRNPEYTKLVDKYEAKIFISSVVGEKYVVPTLGIWDRFEEIDFDSLPEQFVLKCTHDSGGLVICREKSSFDIESARKKIKDCLKTNYFWHSREWPYKNIRPRIIAEEYLEEVEHTETYIEKQEFQCNSNQPAKIEHLTDYKFFCFNGEPKIMYCSKDMSKMPRTDFFDMQYSRLPIRMRDPNSEHIPPKPAHFEEMKRLAAQLAKGHPHLRVDFYEVGKQIYIGELTFFHCSGFVKITPNEWDKIMGDWIKLPPKCSQ